MKINEKHLAAFVNSKAPIDRQGFMLKRGELNKANQRRWFILKGNLLFYFEHREDREPVGVIILEGCSVEPDDSYDAKTFAINFKGSRRYVLTCHDYYDMAGWVQAISCSSYDYMKLMVQELQKQLEELNLADRTKLFRYSSNEVGRYVTDVPLGVDALQMVSSAPSLSRGKLPSSNVMQDFQRINPFDREEPDELLNEASFDKIVKIDTLVDLSNDRDFGQMHRDFGEKINRVVQSYTGVIFE